MQKRNRSPQTQPLEERLADHAARLREEAKALPAGKVRDAVLMRAEQAQSGAEMRMPLTTRA
jgi:hypothetical protein